MIVRVFRAESKVSDVQAYRDFLAREIFPELKTLGAVGAELLVHESEGAAQLMVQSRWPSLESIRTFAGDDLTRAVVEPAAKALLTRFDDRVTHYDVVMETD